MTIDALNFSGRRRLPIFRSSEAAECGLACLAMVACWHGHDLDLNGVRERIGVSRAGMRLSGLMEAARGLGLASRALKTPLEDLPNLKTPAILHWNLNHFVVLAGCDRKGVVVHDPNLGVRRLGWSEVSSAFTGVALELSAVADFQPVSARRPTRITTLWSRVEGFWPAVGQVAALSIALQLLTFATPFYLQLVIDDALLRTDLTLLGALALAFGAIIALLATVEALRSWTLQVAGQLGAYQVGANLVAHLLRLRSEFFEKRHLGDILSRLASAKAIQEILTKGAVAALLDGVTAAGCLLLLFLYSPLLAGIVTAGLACQLTIAWFAYPAIRRRTEEQLIASGAEQTFLMETVRAATVIKLQGGEATREAGWRNASARVVNAVAAVSKWQIGVQFLQTLLGGVQLVLVVYLGARVAMAGGGMSIGMLVGFLAFRQQLSDRVGNLVTQAVQFRMIGLHLERLGDIVHAQRDDESAGLLDRGEVNGGLTLRDVDFRYGEGEPLILRRLSLDVAAGEFLAITGRSGVGKSTLLKIILGVQRPSGGEVLLDGRPAGPGEWQRWRRAVGVVAQDDRLLSGSLAQNIASFDPDLDMSRVVDAARRALIHDEIERMPMRYLTPVGDMGATLSGGQKQRVLLARALYRNPKVLVLDEGTANLDLETEDQLAEMIAKLPVTRIVIAHRPALIERADRTLVLAQGTLAEDEALAVTKSRPWQTKPVRTESDHSTVASFKDHFEG